jgi:hypothetical protein
MTYEDMFIYENEELFNDLYTHMRYGLDKKIKEWFENDEIIKDYKNKRIKYLHDLYNYKYIVEEWMERTCNECK